jgi:hypothetical protein
MTLILFLLLLLLFHLLLLLQQLPQLNHQRLERMLLSPP